MIPVPPDRVAALLVRDLDQALAKISLNYDINGFAFVFEIGQPQPTFFLAINTKKNGQADASTGEWDFPAGGFEGDEMSPEWQDCYQKLEACVMEDDDSESRLQEVQAVFRRAMREIRQRWQPRLGQCLFTVNECNDSDQAIQAAYEDINGEPASGA